MSDTIRFKADGRDVEGRRGASLLGVLLGAGFDIPHLCRHEAVGVYESCRLCLVEVRRHGRARVVASCSYPVLEGIEVFTAGEKILRLRRTILELHLAHSPKSEPLRRYAAGLGVEETRFRIADPGNACILCGRCERVCTEVIGAHAIGFSGRGAGKALTTPCEAESAECIGCGACAVVCPTGCIRVVDNERDMVREIPFIRARHDLEPCRLCGRPVSTKAHVEHLRRKGLDEQSITTCDACKKLGHARLVAVQGHM